MIIFTFVAILALIILIVSLVLALNGKHTFYWIAAVAVYIFSALSGFSIGQLTVGFTFVFLALAIGYSLRLLKNNYQLYTWLDIDRSCNWWYRSYFCS
ncbi:hypothetical protein [Sutcliffiella rhizosphaerae]|uniref:Uncharacterized protein n=1 Tax=Sutcliffiella rhizosphaerae TaxID=2880967 RepID=A0ABM8YN85_9BACI|nr:hypothetical protein [Sutcliffiella rhizosphaerae]CAG9621275.1 hypothetical protein BACCIP111883_02047 [Sutcliffiella rhizosphaerae]